ncbi:MAG: MBL fold metallo-hydrolase [Oleiphilus sp.]|nr:MAG: MBL fold metallo-hydrolase [Oleiphilus sp.]
MNHKTYPETRRGPHSLPELLILIRRAFDAFRFQNRPVLLAALLSIFIASNALAELNQVTQVRFSAIKTASSAGSLEAMVVAGGNWFSVRKLNHSAILVQHPKGDLLYDTGIGTQIEQQMEVLNFMDKKLFAIEGLNPAREQLDRAGYQLSSLRAIVAGHMHWDHVSGLEDFLGVPVWVPQEALDEAWAGDPPGFIQSQFDDEKINWEVISLPEQPYMGFEKSLDVHKDGSVVLVDLSGHSDGQMGMFINIADDQRFFLIGDTTWTLKGIQNRRSRPRFVQWMTGVDKNYERNADVIEIIHQLSRKHPEIKIVPAHDEFVLDTLPVFPMMSDGSEF